MQFATIKSAVKYASDQILLLTGSYNLLAQNFTFTLSNHQRACSYYKFFGNHLSDQLLTFLLPSRLLHPKRKGDVLGREEDTVWVESVKNVLQVLHLVPATADVPSYLLQPHYFCIHLLQLQHSITISV